MAASRYLGGHELDRIKTSTNRVLRQKVNALSGK